MLRNDAPAHPADRLAPPAATSGRERESGGHHWPLERVLFLMAGTMTALAAALSALVSPWFLLLVGFVAVNQLAFVAFGNCPSSWVLSRYLGFRSACS